MQGLGEDVVPCPPYLTRGIPYPMTSGFEPRNSVHWADGAKAENENKILLRKYDRAMTSNQVDPSIFLLC